MNGSIRALIDSLPHNERKTDSMARRSADEPEKEKMGLATLIGIIGGILSIIVVLVGAATFVLALKFRVDLLQPENNLKTMAGKGVTDITTAESNALKDIQRQTTGVLGPYSKVICTQVEEGCDYAASPNPNVPSSASFDVDVPQNRKLVAAWYSLADNVSDVRAFHNLSVVVGGVRTISVLSSAKGPTIDDPTGKPGQVRITIYAMYGAP
jgi:hypothetical protein